MSPISPDILPNPAVKAVGNSESVKMPILTQNEKETFSKLIKRMQLTLRKNSGILMASNIGEGYNDDDERTRTNTDGASYRAG